MLKRSLTSVNYGSVGIFTGVAKIQCNKDITSTACTASFVNYDANFTQ